MPRTWLAAMGLDFLVPFRFLNLASICPPLLMALNITSICKVFKVSLIILSLGKWAWAKLTNTVNFQLIGLDVLSWDSVHATIPGLIFNNKTFAV